MLEKYVERVPTEVVEYYSEIIGGSTTVARRHFAELAKFLLACTEANAIFVPSVDVDEAWHTFLLFSKEYREWCHTCFGRVIDHRPLNKVERGLAFEAFRNTVTLVEEKYGIDESLWERGAWSQAIPR